MVNYFFLYVLYVEQVNCSQGCRLCMRVVLIVLIIGKLMECTKKGK